MFRTSIYPSSGVLGCILCTLLHLVFSTVNENCALVLDTICSSIIRIQTNTPEDGHIDARNM